MKEHGLPGACGEHVPQHVIQGREPEQDPTRVANHALGSHQKQEIVSVSFVKKIYHIIWLFQSLRLKPFHQTKFLLKKDFFS